MEEGGEKDVASSQSSVWQGQAVPGRFGNKSQNADLLLSPANLSGNSGKLFLQCQGAGA